MDDANLGYPPMVEDENFMEKRMKSRIEDRLVVAGADVVTLVEAFKIEPDGEMRGFVAGCFCTRILQITEHNPGSTKSILDDLNVPKKLRAAAEGALFSKRIQ